MTVDIEYSEAINRLAELNAKLASWDTYASNQHTMHIIAIIATIIIIGIIVNMFVVAIFIDEVPDKVVIAMFIIIFVATCVITICVVHPIQDNNLVIEYQQIVSEKETLELYLKSKGLIP